MQSGDEGVTTVYSSNQSQPPWTHHSHIAPVQTQPENTIVISVNSKANDNENNKLLIVFALLLLFCISLFIFAWQLGGWGSVEDVCLMCLIFPLIFGSFNLVPQSEIVVIDESKL